MKGIYNVNHVFHRGGQTFQLPDHDINNRFLHLLHACLCSFACRFTFVVHKNNNGRKGAKIKLFLSLKFFHLNPSTWIELNLVNHVLTKTMNLLALCSLHVHWTGLVVLHRLEQ